MMRQLALSISMCVFACLGLASFAQAQSAITGTSATRAARSFRA